MDSIKTLFIHYNSKVYNYAPMLAYTYISKGNFRLQEKPIPQIEDSRDAIVRVTLGSICTSDLHIKHGSVPRAVPGITVGHNRETRRPGHY